MTVRVHRREKESPQNLAQRFTRVVRQSGILLQKRKGQFHKRAKSNLAKKRSALRREEIKKEYAKIRKMEKPS